MSSTRSVIPPRPRPLLDQKNFMRSQRRSRTWLGLLFLIAVLVLCVAVGAAGALYWSLHKAQGSSTRPVRFSVGNGDTVTTVAARLHQEGLINNSLLFRLDARLHDLGGNLKVGNYHLRPNMSIDQMVAALMVYHSPMISVVIPEGVRAEQIAVILQRAGISGRDFLKEVRHPGLHSPILKDKPASAGLEGYLFPNTYEVPPHYSGRAFASLMVRTLDQKFTPSMRAAAANRGRTVFQTLILASIVEREARVEQERPIIASVYVNRLRSGIGLYADPTVQYAVGTPNNWWPVLTTDQLKVNSPYNTYVHPGMPPGPICDPGLASIQAAISPAKTDFLYFVAKGHGRHAFERTYAQHLVDVAKYQH